MLIQCDDCPLSVGVKCEGLSNSDLCDRVKRGEEKAIRLVTMLVEGSWPQPEMPSLVEQAGNAIQALGRNTKRALSGQAVVATVAERDARMAICRACDRYDAEQVRCRECGCLLRMKTALAAESCPLNPPKWDIIRKLPHDST